MAQRYNSVVLFTPPRLAEERKVYWGGLQQYGQASVATGSFGGLGQLGADAGDAISKVLSTVHGGFMDFVGIFTGQPAQEKARQDALFLAQLQQQQALAEAQARSEGWGKAAPWLAVGGAVVAVAVVMAARRG